MADFGWSYPAGCTGVPDDEPALCFICGQDADTDDCKCPECSKCGEVGNLDCVKHHGLVLVPGSIPLTEQVAVVDFETATYIGDDNDGVYFTVEQGPAGGWYLSTVVDCDTGGFCTEMDTDDGPYDTEKAAMTAGEDAANDWCCTNDIDLTPEPGPSGMQRLASTVLEDE